MDNSKSRVMAEIAAGFRQKKIKWQTAAFMRFFASPEKKVVVVPERPVMVEEALSPVEEGVSTSVPVPVQEVMAVEYI